MEHNRTDRAKKAPARTVNNSKKVTRKHSTGTTTVAKVADYSIDF